MYLAKAGELKENVPDSDRILYSRQLPRLVMRHSKLEGGKPLKDFQILSHNGRAYVVLSDIPTGKLEPQKKTADYIFFFLFHGGKHRNLNFI